LSFFSGVVFFYKKTYFFRVSASQLAEQYGAGIATEIVARSRPNLQLDTMPYAALSSTTSPIGRHMKYNSKKVPGARERKMSGMSNEATKL
jgi:hypothetical protein